MLLAELVLAELLVEVVLIEVVLVEAVLVEVVPVEVVLVEVLPASVAPLVIPPVVARPVVGPLLLPGPLLLLVLPLLPESPPPQADRATSSHSVEVRDVMRRAWTAGARRVKRGPEPARGLLGSARVSLRVSNLRCLLL